MKKELATFGAGCFWHVQYVFSKLKGILNTTTGYMGGDEKKFPHVTYDQVSTGKTGYIEVVQIEFDKNVISYKELLDTFWKEHNPTSLNHQGPDIGNQYHSIIFYHNLQQKKEAEESKKEIQKKFEKPIVTEIEPVKKFIIAEEYHQNYVVRNGRDICPN